MQVINVPTPPMPPVPPDFVIQSGPPEGVLMAAMLVVGLIVAGVVFAPLIRAFARRIDGKSIDPGLAAEVEQLRGRVAELEDVSHRLAELEERVDFSERLLTQGREQPVIRGQA